MESTNKPAGAKPSKVELTKLASEYLKTFVADELDNGRTHFTEDAASILKFHGSYQQDDRDLRRALKKEGKEHAYQFMVRVRIVGGKLTAGQYLACDLAAQNDRQRQPANHDPSGVSASRRAQARLENDDQAHQRMPALDPRRLRRRRAERALLPGPDQRRVACVTFSPTPCAGPGTAPLARPRTGISGSTVKRSNRCRRLSLRS